MRDTKPHPSVGSLGDRMGPVAAGHIVDAFRAVMSDPGATIAPGFVRLVTGEPHPFGNFVCVAHSTDARAVGDAMGPVASCGAPAAVLVTGAPSAEIERVVTGAGFERHGGMPAMAVDIDSLASTRLSDGYELARVTGTAQREAWGEVFARGYGLPARVGAVFSAGIDGDARGDAPAQYFWVMKRGVPVATSMVFLHDGVAGIYAVATVAEERGKGIGAHLTAEPLRIARGLGYRVGVLQASEDGHPVYLRIGFRDFGEVPLYVKMPG